MLYRSSPDLIGSAVRALSWSPDGAVIVCGCGGDPDNSSKDGAIVVLEVMSASGQLEVPCLARGGYLLLHALASCLLLIVHGYTRQRPSFVRAVSSHVRKLCLWRFSSTARPNLL